MLERRESLVIRRRLLCALVLSSLFNYRSVCRHVLDVCKYLFLRSIFDWWWMVDVSGDYPQKDCLREDEVCQFFLLQ